MTRTQLRGASDRVLQAEGKHPRGGHVFTVLGGPFVFREGMEYGSGAVRGGHAVHTDTSGPCAVAHADSLGLDTGECVRKTFWLQRVDQFEGRISQYVR